jgi:hypothetical protein
VTSRQEAIPPSILFIEGGMTGRKNLSGILDHPERYLSDFRI